MISSCALPAADVSLDEPPAHSMVALLKLGVPMSGLSPETIKRSYISRFSKDIIKRPER